MAGFWNVFLIENSRFALDTLRVANRSPTPASKIYDFLGLLDDILGVRGRLSRPILGIPGVRPEPNIYIFDSFQKPATCKSHHHPTTSEDEEAVMAPRWAANKASWPSFRSTADELDAANESIWVDTNHYVRNLLWLGRSLAGTLLL